MHAAFSEKTNYANRARRHSKKFVRTVVTNIVNNAVTDVVEKAVTMGASEFHRGATLCLLLNGTSAMGMATQPPACRNAALLHNLAHHA
jgi:hypothetical protein